jgi:hypothetical protein
MRAMRSVLLIAVVSAASCSPTLAFQPGRVSAPLTRFGTCNSVKHRFHTPNSDSVVTDTALHFFRTTRQQAPAPEPEIGIPSYALNVPAAVAWVALVAWTFTVAPGELQSPSDTAMLAGILADPVHPGMNALFYTLFNCFAVIPVLLASVILPQGQSIGLPAGPFLFLSSFIGYFGFGPYLALRAPPRNMILDAKSEVSWFTRNVLENKICSVLTVAICLYLPVGAGLISAYQEDPTELWSGFVNLVSGSRFASVSTVDLTLLWLCTVAATPADYLLRHPDQDEAQARKVAAFTALVPFLGSAVYCALRPPLPQAEQEE